MKYLVKFQLDEKRIRKDYRRTLISFFKSAISDYMDGMFYGDLYEKGTLKKAFVWSLKLDHPIFSEGGIELGSTNAEMTMKFADAQTALIYYAALLAKRGQAHPVGEGNHIRLISIKMLREGEISSDFAVFKVCSPICLRRHMREGNKDYYVSCKDAEFAEELGRKLKEELPFMEEEVQKLRFNFDGLKKIIVFEYGLKMPVSIGSFAVSGDRRILNHILKNGLGSRRNSGFGLVERAM